MTDERIIIERIRAMKDPAEVDRQLEEVRKVYREVTSEVRLGLADVRQWLSSSPLFTQEDLNDELKELEPAANLQMTLLRYEKELVDRLNQLTKEK